MIHRANFHSALHQRAVDLGVTIKLGSRVAGYDAPNGTIFLDNGSSASGDLVIAADGKLLSFPGLIETLLIQL